MIQGLYAAASGMISLEDRMAVTANNVANASTPGFRTQNAIQRGFDEVLLSQYRRPVWLNSEKAPGGGLRTLETFTDTRSGPVTMTGNALNVALSGPGYIAVSTAGGERYTRNGSFTIDGDGQLSTTDGLKVLGQGGGGIDASGGSVEIDEEGRVSVDGREAGRIRLVEFEDPHGLTREGHNLYAATTPGAEATETRVAPKSLEMSNVQVPYEMTQMTLALRMYSANQKVINAFDETMTRLINEVGAPV